MKKLIISFGVILSGYICNSSAFIPCLPKADVALPYYCGGFKFGVTGLYWRPNVLKNNYETIFPDNNFDFRLPLARFTDFSRTDTASALTFDPNYDWGFKVNVGYTFPCSGYDFNFTYTRWNDTTTEHTNELVTIPVGTRLFATETGPTIPFTGIAGPGINQSFPAVLRLTAIVDNLAFTPDPLSTEVRAALKLENNTIDLDFGYAVILNCDIHLHWFAGLRYSKLKYDQETALNTFIEGTTVTSAIDSEFFGVPTLLDPTETGRVFEGRFLADVTMDATIMDTYHHHSKFDGVGPRIGVDLNHSFLGAFGIVGGLSAALIIGESSSIFTDRILSNGSALFTDFIRVSTIVIDPNISLVVPTAINAPSTFTSPISDDTGLFRLVQPDITRIVPNVDVKLGVNWTYQFCNASKLSIEVGYLISHYFNSIEIFNLGSFSDPDNTHAYIDTTFDGPYFSAQVAL